MDQVGCTGSWLTGLESGHQEPREPGGAGLDVAAAGRAPGQRGGAEWGPRVLRARVASRSRSWAGVAGPLRPAARSFASVPGLPPAEALPRVQAGRGCGSGRDPETGMPLERGPSPSPPPWSASGVTGQCSRGRGWGSLGRLCAPRGPGSGRFRLRNAGFSPGLPALRVVPTPGAPSPRLGPPFGRVAALGAQSCTTRLLGPHLTSKGESRGAGGDWCWLQEPRWGPWRGPRC